MLVWGLARASLWGVPYLSLNLPKVDYKMKIDKDPNPFFLLFFLFFFVKSVKYPPSRMFFWGLARASLWGVPYLSLDLPKVDYKMKIDKDPNPFF